ncbi:MAG: hybrid sensor histidine kinase/response regulator [bacterium]|nr:hybrid sensor histidine kinase/response regulator [bacterium]
MTLLDPSAQPGRLLIVDDVARNIQLVALALKKEGHSISYASSGAEALQMAVKQEYDLILLDIMMPEMDGFEVCRQLKANPATQETPVIFLTAKTDAESIIEAFQLGAVDYISKPFLGVELKLRIRNHLELRRIRRELSENNKLKDKFFSILAHDLRSPFNALLGLSEVLKDEAEELPRAELANLAQKVFDSGVKVNDLMEQLLSWSRSQRGKIPYEPSQLVLAEMAQETIELLSATAERKNIQLQQLVDPQVQVWADRYALLTILRNLVGNAIKFTPRGGSVRIEASQGEDWTQVAVVDSGMGIGAKDLTDLFRIDRNRNSRGTEGESGTGLGLILCKELAEQNQGSISVSSKPDQGSRFALELPRHPHRENPP